mmetsp:Transcript_12075/g.28630  ORF Transcript_12075/g.28630 Transcript_12075/m.28630 type:complete len:248 (-) Transcript_12075:377-1120(-)
MTSPAYMTLGRAARSPQSRGIGGMTLNVSRKGELSPLQRGSERMLKRHRPRTEPLRHHSTPLTRSTPGTRGRTSRWILLCSLALNDRSCSLTRKASAGADAASARLSEEEEAEGGAASWSHSSRIPVASRAMPRGFLNSMSTPMSSCAQQTLKLSSSIERADLPASQLPVDMAEDSPPMDSDSCRVSQVPSATEWASGFPLYLTPSMYTEKLSGSSTGSGRSSVRGPSPATERRFSSCWTAPQNSFM